ncbi:MAG TPA: ABC transporter ATP-binding protein [Actinomycetes bacterium]|jgi:branched-chain amino acid transport system ATP-binding protein|nr:ABC transporter ATP-binding protein [Actinomycetes bacterium]
MAGRLELEGVVAGYGGGDVLQGVDLRVEPASITCIVGPNGAGKSTVLRTVSGLLPPRKGTIVLDGRPVGGLDAAAVLERGVVQVPQHGGLFPSLSVRENVLMGAWVLRRDRGLVRRRYEHVVETLPILVDWADRRAGNLSGGQRRLVEFARSLMVEPAVVLLDEPSLGLDPASLKQVYDLVKLLNEQGVSILLVEQNVRLGLAAATWAVVMESGRVRLAGSPQEVLDHPEIADLYLGGTISRSAKA